MRSPVRTRTRAAAERLARSVRSCSNRPVDRILRTEESKPFAREPSLDVAGVDHPRASRDDDRIAGTSPLLPDHSPIGIDVPDVPGGARIRPETEHQPAARGCARVRALGRKPGEVRGVVGGCRRAAGVAFGNGSTQATGQDQESEDCRSEATRAPEGRGAARDETDARLSLLGLARATPQRFELCSLVRMPGADMRRPCASTVASIVVAHAAPRESTTSEASVAASAEEGLRAG